MANNYTEFSFAIPLRTDEQKAWGREVKAYLDSAVANDCIPVCTHCAVDLAVINEHTLSAMNDGEGDDCDGHELHPLADLLSGDDYLGYNVEVDSDELWIYAEEGGTPEYVVPLAQAYLEKFDPDGSLGFCWADTCSKPRLDEFGGGAVFITATDAKWINTYQWLGEQERARAIVREPAAQPEGLER